MTIEGVREIKLRIERMAAAAGAHGIRVLKGEARALQAIGEIQFRTFEIKRAFGIQIDFHAMLFEHVIVRALIFIQREKIREAGAAAALHANAQTQVGFGFLRDDFFNFSCRFGSEGYHVRLLVEDVSFPPL